MNKSYYDFFKLTGFSNHAINKLLTIDDELLAHRESKNHDRYLMPNQANW